MNTWFRRIHRWLSVAFTIAVVINTVAAVRKTYADWMGLLALLPLAILLITGVYLFALPYLSRARNRHPTTS